jgi:uncharacterized protein with PQ loop repeat
MQGNGVLKHHARRQKLLKGQPLVENWATRVMDVIIYPVGFLSVLMTLPQAYDVWILGKTDGLSLVTWASWTFFASLWTLYGVVHKSRVLIVIHGSWIFMNGLVALGIILNR